MMNYYCLECDEVKNYTEKLAKNIGYRCSCGGKLVPKERTE